MENVQLRDVEVIDEADAGLLCRVDTQQLTIPRLLSGTGHHDPAPGRPRDSRDPALGGIGFGLVWPLAGPGVRPGHDPGNELRKRHGPRGAPHVGRARRAVASGDRQT